MSNALLVDIDSALYTALSALVAGPTTAQSPFAVAARYAGPVTKKGLSNVCREQYPAVLLRFDAEGDARDIAVWDTLTTEEVGESSWSIIVVVADPREVDQGMVGDANTPGALRLIDAALGAVNALAISGTYQSITARAVETRAELVEDGVVYAFSTRLVVRRVLPQATNPDPAAGLPLVQPIVGAENLIDGHGDAEDVNPLVTFQADPNPT